MYQVTSPTHYTQNIWKRRYFWWSLVLLDLRSRYKRSVLGLGWSLLHPLCMTVVLCVAFHSIFNVNIREFAPFVLVGMAVWTFIATTVGEGCLSIISAEGYIKSTPAPLAIYPMRAALSTTVHFLLTLVVALGIVLAISGKLALLPLVSLVPSILILFVFGWALATILGIVNVHLGDTQHLVTIVLQMLFYLTPVMYPPSMMEGRPIIGDIVKYNPFTQLISLFRDPLVNGTFPALGTYAATSLTAAVLAVVAVVVLARSERNIVFYM